MLDQPTGTKLFFWKTQCRYKEGGAKNKNNGSFKWAQSFKECGGDTKSRGAINGKCWAKHIKKVMGKNKIKTACTPCFYLHSIIDAK